LALGFYVIPRHSVEYSFWSFDIPEVEIYYKFSVGPLDLFSPEMRYFGLILVGRMSVFRIVFSHVRMLNVRPNLTHGM